MEFQNKKLRDVADIAAEIMFGKKQEEVKVETQNDNTQIEQLSESVQQVQEADIEKTATGMKVYGSSYGNSQRARREQVKRPVDDAKGPKAKELKSIESEKKSKKFSEDLEFYKENGLKGLFEAWAKKKAMKEEASQEEFNKEIKKAQAKSEGKDKAEVAKPAVQAVQNEENVSEELKGGQKKLDKNHNGKLDSDDFKKLRNEETHTKVEVLDFDAVNGVQVSEIDLEEKTLTADETAEKERIAKGMKKKVSGFKDRYGDRAKEVMYATATKLAKE